MMNKSFILVFVITLVYIQGYSQEIDMRNLYFGHQKHDISELLILNKENAIAVMHGPGKLCLLNKERQFCDTIPLVFGYQHLLVTGKSTFTVMALNWSASYQVVNDEIQVLQGYYFTKAVKKGFDTTNFSYYDRTNTIDQYAFTPFGKYIISCKKNKGSKQSWKYGYIATNLNTQKSVVIAGPFNKSIAKRSYNFMLPFSFIYHHNKVYINNARMNKCFVFNTADESTYTIHFPKPKKGDKASWQYFYDYQQEKEYLVKFTPKSKDNLIFLFNGDKTEYIASVRFVPISFVDAEVHVVETIEGNMHHFLIPLQSLDKNEKRVLLEEVKVSK